MKLASSLLTTAFAAAFSTLALAGCTSESSGGGGGSGGSTGTETTTDSTTSDTGPVALTGKDVAGEWASAGCEAYPDGKGGESYLTRDFTLTETTWDLSFSVFGDKDCKVALFTAQIHGPFTLGALSKTADGATEGQFAFETNAWTAHNQQMADTFTGAGCGAGAWEVDKAQEVGGTGCIGVAHKIADCPEEYDLVGIKDGRLYFGERITDMCTEAGRPAALGPYGLTKK